MDNIDILYDKHVLDQGIEYYHKLQLNTASWLVFGPSGSGKSVLSKLIIGRISLKIADAKITVCDGKADDYTFLRNIPNARFFEYTDMSIGLTQFYNEFNSRLSGNPDRSFRLIVLEEWSSYLRIMEEIDKKTAKTSLAQLFSITSQGRSYNVHSLVVLQRPQADFLSGFRENLTTVIGLGSRISSEAARMVGFNEFDEFSNDGGGQGIGWMLSERGLNYIQVPKIRNFEKLHNAIKDAVTR